MEYLPQEIVLDILSRLPVTSILQFKLVCKSWLNTAKHPLLPCMQFSNMDKNDPCLIFHCDYPIRNQLYSFELSSRDDEDNNQTVNQIRVPTLPEFNVVGSCKGLLLCLCNSDDSSTKKELYVYNPFTRHCIELPKSIEFQNQDVVFGFGFHPTTNKYKVVKIDYFRNIHRGNYRLCGRGRGYGKSDIQIFTLGSESWRNLGQVTYHMMQGSSEVLVNGRLHWCTWPRLHGPSRLIISFDIADEQFRDVPKPDEGLQRIHFDLVNLGGCLSAAVPCSSGKEIWVMKEYGVKESWIMQYNIGVHIPRVLLEQQDLSQSFRDSKFYKNRSFVRVLCLLKNGEILLEYKCRALVSYDPRNETFKDLLFPGMPIWFEAAVHEGGLNWIDTSIDK